MAARELTSSAIMDGMYDCGLEGRILYGKERLLVLLESSDIYGSKHLVAHSKERTL